MTSPTPRSAPFRRRGSSEDGDRPEALYWAGVSRYKGTNDPTALKDTARAFTERYQESSWAKKSSVWKG